MKRLINGKKEIRDLNGQIVDMTRKIVRLERDGRSYECSCDRHK